MKDSEQNHADKQTDQISLEPSKSKPNNQEITQLTWDQLQKIAALPELEKLSARLSKMEEITESIHLEVKRHRLGREVMSHLLAMMVVVGLERSGSYLKEVIDKTYRVDVQVEQGVGGSEFIMP